MIVEDFQLIEQDCSSIVLRISGPAKNKNNQQNTIQNLTNDSPDKPKQQLGRQRTVKIDDESIDTQVINGRRKYCQHGLM